MNPEKTADLPEVIDNLSHDVVQMLHVRDHILFVFEVANLLETIGSI